MNNIYCYLHEQRGKDYFECRAVTEDDIMLASHVSSTLDFAKGDIGFKRDWYYKKYDKFFGKGNWKLVWIDNISAGLKELGISA